MQDSLQEILAQKKQKLEAEAPQWTKTRDEWIARVNDLFKLSNFSISPGSL
ncbi:MAG: hypothetical protein GY749_01680 [Desulfobacteraceae bacterium]|nr:hypothetical protein [Desulfobacteraceae bacterium]